MPDGTFLVLRLARNHTKEERQQFIRQIGLNPRRPWWTQKHNRVSALSGGPQHFRKKRQSGTRFIVNGTDIFLFVPGGSQKTIRPPISKTTLM